MVSDAYRFLIPLLLVAAALAYAHQPTPALLCLILSAYIGYFFRNPERDIPLDGNLVVSPADGKVVSIRPLDPGDGMGEGNRVSIFLNIFNVHVNRSPIAGQVEKFEYKRGRFKAAYDEEASQVNEQNIITLRGQGMQVVLKQIAGLIARRVVFWKSPGNPVERGELIGLIRFGSRVDVLLPSRVQLLVRVGDKVKGGSSILGECQ